MNFILSAGGFSARVKYLNQIQMNVHEPRTIEQKFATITVNIKEIEDSATAHEIKEKLDRVVQGIINDSTGQQKIAPEIQKLKKNEDEKVVGPARKARASAKEDPK